MLVRLWEFIASANIRRGCHHSSKKGFTTAAISDKISTLNIIFTKGIESYVASATISRQKKQSVNKSNESGRSVRCHSDGPAICRPGRRNGLLKHSSQWKRTTILAYLLHDSTYFSVIFVVSKGQSGHRNEYSCD